jgi:hypothetical protein
MMSLFSFLFIFLNEISEPLVRTNSPEIGNKIIIKEDNEYKIIDSRDWDNQEYHIIIWNDKEE